MRLLINEKTNPLTLHGASWAPDAPISVRKESISFHMWRGGGTSENGEKTWTSSIKRCKKENQNAEGGFKLSGP